MAKKGIDQMVLPAEKQRGVAGLVATTVELALLQLNRQRWKYALLILLGLVVLPWVFDRPFYLNLLILVFMYITLAHAWNLLAGYAGQVSLGQHLFFGLGAYTSTLLSVRGGISPWLGMIAANLVALVAAVLIGYPTFKLKQHYFTIATLLLGQIAPALMVNWTWAGGAAGINLPFHDPSLIAFQFNAKFPYYYIALGMAVIGTITVSWMERSRLGYYFRAIKDEPDAAQMVGVNITYYKLVAMVLHACLTATAGVFFAQYVLFIDPESVFNSVPSILTMLAVMIGGVGTLIGPLVGVLVMVPLSELTRAYLGGSGTAIDLVIYGALAVTLGILQPRGIIRMSRLLRY